MKKTIVLLSAIILLSIAPVLATIGPVPVDESNVLPDFINVYGTVTITKIPDTECAEIIAEANQNILEPLSNFGIQRFGFNYAGNVYDLWIWGKPTSWTVKRMSEFGLFLSAPEINTPGIRVTKLDITVCNMAGTLDEKDVIVPNAEGYTFALHIADFNYDGTAYNVTSSAFFSTKKTTAITLASFEAKPGNRKVKVIWETGDETDNLGFNIYRSESADGEYVKINDNLIQSKVGSGLGASYEYIDNNVQNRKAYYYKLEDVDVDGIRTTHDPVKSMPRWIYALIYAFIQ